MTVAGKAIARIERVAAGRGGYPACIDLTLYPDAETFARFHPGGDYSVYVAERAALSAWCRARFIEVVDRKVAAAWPATAKERARKAVRKPYRLGLKMGKAPMPSTPPTSAIGWQVVWLSHSGEGGEE